MKNLIWLSLIKLRSNLYLYTNLAESKPTIEFNVDPHTHFPSNFFQQGKENRIELFLN